MLMIPCCLVNCGVVKALTASATAMRIIRHDEVNIFILGSSAVTTNRSAGPHASLYHPLLSTCFNDHMYRIVVCSRKS